jgi:hypothetical protein
VWLTITGPASGTGNGSIAFGAAPKNDGDPTRTGTLTIAGQTFTVTEQSSNDQR